MLTRQQARQDVNTRLTRKQNSICNDRCRIIAGELQTINARFRTKDIKTRLRKEKGTWGATTRIRNSSQKAEVKRHLT